MFSNKNQDSLMYPTNVSVYLSLYFVWVLALHAVWRIIMDSMCVPTDPQPCKTKYKVKRVVRDISSSPSSSSSPMMLDKFQRRFWWMPPVWKKRITAMMMWAPFQAPLIPTSTVLPNLLPSASDHNDRDDDSLDLESCAVLKSESSKSSATCGGEDGDDCVEASSSSSPSSCATLESIYVEELAQDVLLLGDERSSSRKISSGSAGGSHGSAIRLIRLPGKLGGRVVCRDTNRVI
eukprot:CAMPEP_0185844884 /NCGR_PEP_ID=MMETSP1354-20130828/983_1 /TAXON_ID=708628 /ORGANISM="Erythrolobus madagascarensis, Strain CCMP3276" /LENGTH=234 /DNA_ID=CAMNT_0028544695 /DNA_START=279 /DNA_END=983 /DNA_ORIENTATION=+